MAHERFQLHTIQAFRKDIEYFPAFEIMMDELRDYRFYAEDMLHPSPVAVDHVWRKFMDVYFNKETIEFIDNWSKIRKALAHKPFNPQSEKHQKFILKTIKRLKEFSNKVDVKEEVKFLKSQLK